MKNDRRFADDLPMNAVRQGYCLDSASNLGRYHPMSRLLISLAGIAALVPPASAAGREPEKSAETIIVTGQRQDRPLALEPSSVVVLTDLEIETFAGADRLDEILALVPNVQLGSGGEGPTIRGQDSTGALRDLPAFLGGTRPRVTVQVDGRPIGYNELAFGTTGIWDVKQIEVFRSPQTTTQGRNSIAGAIFIKTADPSFEWEGRARTVVGGAATRQGSAVISGPILPGELAFRISGDVHSSRTGSEISSVAVNADYNRDTYEVARFKLLATPSAVPGLRLLATMSRKRSAAPQIEGVRAPFAERRDPEATYGLFRTNVDSGTLRVDYGLAERWWAKVTITAGDATIRRLAPPGFGEAQIAGRDSSLEAVLTWRHDHGMRLLAGINRARESLNQQIDLSAAVLGRGEFADRQVSLGLFGEADLKLAPRFELSVGLRYQSDLQTRSGVLGIGNGDPLLLNYRQRQARLLPKLTASYDLRRSVRIGARIQRAYNPGGVTLDALRRVPDTFGPETLWAFEAFARVFSPDSPVSLSASGFYYDIRNAQRTIQREIPTSSGVVTIAEIDNAPAAHAYGAEFQLEWRSSSKIDVAAAVGLLHTRLTRTLSPADPLLGKEFQRAPRLTGSITASARPSPTWRLSFQLRHNSGYFSDDANTLSRRVSGATVTDMEAAWTSGGMTFSLHARNLFDSFHLTYLFSPRSRLATAGDPREIGGSASVRF